MSIHFVTSLEEAPKKHPIEVGVRVIFTTVQGLVKPCEIIEPDGTSIAFGIPAVA